MSQVAFLSRAFDQFTDWSTRDRKTFERIVRLTTESARTPFTETGKPEALKHDLKGCWSRRIDHEHRLVYKVTDEQIVILACRYHYGD
jgi:toxin YoeB